MRRALCLAFLLAALAPAVCADDETDVKVKWYGQACFELRFPTGLVVLCDPFDAGKIGKYVFPKDVKPDLVTVSHEHFDHSNSKEVSGSPEVLRGLTSADAKTHEWQKHDKVVKGVRVRTVGVYHDEKEGKERGKNAIFVFEPEKAGAFGTIAHLGDLGHVLTDEQIKAIGPVDALLIPVGGTFTIDAEAAKKVCDQLKPRVLIVPMHYKTDGLDPKIPLSDASAFLKLYEGKVKKAEGPETTVPKKGELQVVVLEWKSKEEAVPKGTSLNLELKEARAWVNSQGPGKPELNLNAELSYSVSDGATLAVKASIDGKAISLEDEDGKAIPAKGQKLPAGKNKKLVLHAASGQTAAAGSKVKIEWVLEAGTSKSSGSSTVEVQDVR